MENKQIRGPVSKDLPGIRWKELQKTQEPVNMSLSETTVEIQASRIQTNLEL